MKVLRFERDGELSFDQEASDDLLTEGVVVMQGEGEGVEEYYFPPTFLSFPLVFRCSSM